MKIIWSAHLRQSQFFVDFSASCRISPDNAGLGIMRPTANLRQVLLAILEHRVIAAIGVRLQVTVIAFQELFRPLPL